MSTTATLPAQRSADLAPWVARFTIGQYEQMIGAGVFENGFGRQRVELLEGTITQMTPINYAHAMVVDEAAEWAFDAFPRDRFRVRVQNPVLLSASASIPEPDIVVADRGRWGGRHPQPEHLRLVVEVADASLSHDLGAKARIYAEAGIAEYWVLDLGDRAVHVHRDPTKLGYGTVLKIVGSQEFAPLVCESARVEPARFFSGLGGEGG